MKKSAFTLIELLLVIGIIAILAGIVILAINPSMQLRKAEDAKRTVHIRELKNAIIQYQIDYGFIPTGISTTQKPICKYGLTNPSCVNVDVLIDQNYITALDLDVLESDVSVTGYSVKQNADGHVEVSNAYIGMTADTINTNTLNCNNAVVNDTGLIGYWNLNEGTDTNLTDSSITSANGILSDTSTWSTDVPQVCPNNTSSLVFDGTNKYASLGIANQYNPLTEPTTWMIWFKTDTDGSGGDFNWRTLMHFSGGGGWWGGGHDSMLQFRITSTGNINALISKKLSSNVWQAASVSSTNIVNDNQWHHAAFTWDFTTKTVELFLDGVSQGTNTNLNINEVFITQSNRCSTGDHTLVIGVEESYNCANRNRFIGNLDEPRVYNRVLLPSEILAIANGTN